MLFSKPVALAIRTGPERNRKGASSRGANDSYSTDFIFRVVLRRIVPVLSAFRMNSLRDFLHFPLKETTCLEETFLLAGYNLYRERATL